MTVREGWGLNN